MIKEVLIITTNKFYCHLMIITILISMIININIIHNIIIINIINIINYEYYYLNIINFTTLIVCIPISFSV